MEQSDTASLPEYSTEEDFSDTSYPGEHYTPRQSPSRRGKERGFYRHSLKYEYIYYKNRPKEAMRSEFEKVDLESLGEHFLAFTKYKPGQDWFLSPIDVDMEDRSSFHSRTNKIQDNPYRRIIYQLYPRLLRSRIRNQITDNVFQSKLENDIVTIFYDKSTKLQNSFDQQSYGEVNSDLQQFIPLVSGIPNVEKNIFNVIEIQSNGIVQFPFRLGSSLFNIDMLGMVIDFNASTNYIGGGDIATPDDRREMIDVIYGSRTMPSIIFKRSQFLKQTANILKIKESFKSVKHTPDENDWLILMPILINIPKTILETSQRKLTFIGNKSKPTKPKATRPKYYFSDEEDIIEINEID